MKHRNLWIGMILVVISTLGLSACGSGATYEKIEPAELVDQGDGRNLVILTEKAAERLDIQTEMVTEEEILLTQTFGGEVTEKDPAGRALVMVSLTSEEISSINPSVPARVIPLNNDDAEDDDANEGLEAELDELPGLDDDEDSLRSVLHYSVSDGSKLEAGQRLMVEVTLLGENAPQLVVPFSSLLYDVNGETYVYINPEPLHFLRVPVVVNHIRGDRVILEEGPEVGTLVVIVGAVELFGTDTGVGK